MTGMWQVPGYTETKDLGAGRRGRAVLVRHDHSGRPYVITYRTAADPAARQRFHTESALLQRINSRYVADWHGHLDHGSRSAVLLEAVDGVSLREILARQVSLSPEAALLVLKNSLLGLAAAHLHGVVHRDHNPANVVVRKDGLSKLIGFGVAVLQGSSGTPHYTAPEQWAGEPVGPSTDMYAATCVFFECLIGRPPFPGTAKAHRSAPIPLDDVPAELRDLVAAGLAKTMADRPASAATFVADLETVAEATYGPRWEENGLNLLGATAGGLSALFALAPAVSPTSSGGTANWKAALVMAGALALGAAGVTFVLTAKPASVAPLAFAHHSEAHLEYLQVTGGNPDVRDLVNALLRAPLDNVGCALNVKATPGLLSPKLLTARYDFVRSDECGGQETESVIIDLQHGTRLFGPTLWNASALTPEGIRTLSASPGCEASSPKRAAFLTGVSLVLSGQGAELVRKDGCPVKIDYLGLRPYLRPEVYALLPA
jgi:hypothetical protein